MCVIAYKPLGTMFPTKETLQNCFENNPDGAGFMYAFKDKVHIKKGYTTFEGFEKALKKARNLTGDDVPYVMHFRIATQGFEKSMTHPFPLSQNMNELKHLHCSTDIGVAHNGIIDLTSDGSKEYSDTMLFISDYLSLIIKKKSWYKDEDKKLLIERLISGSRLAILDKNSHCELLGKTWIEDNGCFYSNNSYSYKKVKWTYPALTKSYKPSIWESDYNWSSYDPYDKYFNPKTSLYDFDERNCPAVMDFDDSYCYECSHSQKCKYAQPYYYEA